MIAALEAVCSEHVHPVVEKTYIYILIHAGRVVYVGQTNNVESRIRQHWGYGKLFDRVLSRVVPDDDASRYEGALIRALLPVLNAQCPLYCGNDNGALVEFGLAPHEDEAANAARANATIISRRRPQPRPTTSYCRRPVKAATIETNLRRNAKLKTRGLLFDAVMRDIDSARWSATVDALIAGERAA